MAIKPKHVLVAVGIFCGLEVDDQLELHRNVLATRTTRARAPIHRTPLANSLSWMKRQPARSAAPRSSLAPEIPRMLPTIT